MALGRLGMKVEWRSGQLFVDGRVVDCLVVDEVGGWTTIWALDPRGAQRIGAFTDLHVEVPEAPTEPPWWEWRRPRYD